GSAQFRCLNPQAILPRSIWQPVFAARDARAKWRYRGLHRNILIRHQGRSLSQLQITRSWRVIVVRTKKGTSRFRFGWFEVKLVEAGKCPFTGGNEIADKHRHS